MLGWMVYVLIVGVVLSVAGLLAERAMRGRTASLRWIWVVTLAISLVLPGFFFSTRAEKTEAQQTSRHVLNVDAQQQWLYARTGLADVQVSLDSTLRRAWLTLSLVALLLLAANTAYLEMKRRTWRCGSVCGEPVYLARDAGPAVFGWLHSSIVVPSWILTLRHEEQAHVIEHEKSHIHARDPQLLAAGLALLVLMPWNLALWWQVRRLRRAIEVDCDARLLRQGLDPLEYASTLLTVGERSLRYVPALTGMSESASFLEERIQLMSTRSTKNRHLFSVLPGVASLAMVAVAAAVNPPADALDRYTGYYQYADNAVVTVKREGDHLAALFPARPPDTLKSVGEASFQLAGTNAQLSFVGSSGQASAAVLHQNGADTHMPRLDPAIAQQQLRQTEQRIRGQSVNADSQQTLTRLIEAIAAGEPGQVPMNAQLNAAVTHDLPQLQAKLAQLGPMKSMRSLGVSDGGLDEYEVQHEHGTSSWALSLDSSGTIVGAHVPL